MINVEQENTGGGGGGSIDDLTDVDINRSLATGDILVFNGATNNFEPATSSQQADASSCFYHDFVYTPNAAGDTLAIPFDVSRIGDDPAWVTDLTSTQATVSSGIYSVDWITGFDYASAVSGTVRAYLQADGDANFWDATDYVAANLPHQAALDVAIAQHTTIMRSPGSIGITFFAVSSAAVAGVYGTVRIAKLA